MDPALLALDALQRSVEAKTVSVLQACDQLRGIIHEVAKDDSRQFFRQIFPKLLHFIIGHKSSLGLLERCTDLRAAGQVKALLDPQGELFSAVLYLQATDAVTRFEVPVSDFSEEPSVQGPEKSIKLDYCDFFYFHLIKVVTAIPTSADDVTRPAAPGHGVRDLYRRFVAFGLGVPFNERSCRWNHDLIADTFISILQDHLEFVLPTVHGKELNAFTSPIFRGKLLTAAKLGESLSGIINQLWFIQSKSVRKLPTLDVVHSAEVVVRHLCSAMCLNPATNRYMTQTIEASFAALRLHLYRFLRTNLQDWPMDNNFIALIAVWRAFAAPWASLNLAEDITFWHPYVLNNFCFYILPFNRVLEHVEGSLEALVSLQIRTKLVLQGEDFIRRLAPSIDCLHLALGVTSPIAELLRSVEASELVGRRSTEYRIREQFAALEPEMRSIPASFDGIGVGRAMNLIRWLERAHSVLQKLGLTQSELALDGKILECQDELAHAFSVNDITYTQFVKEREAAEASESTSSLTPRRRNLIPSTPDSKLAAIQSISVSKKSFRNDQIPILVLFFDHATVLINRFLHWTLMKASEKVTVPPWAFHYCRVDLRFLAVWQNLLFSFTMLSLCWVLLKILF